MECSTDKLTGPEIPDENVKPKRRDLDVNRPWRTKLWLKLEYVSIALGMALLAAFTLVRISGSVGAWLGLASFAAAHSTAIAQSSSPGLERSPGIERTDFSLWSEKRIKAFRESLTERFAPPLALLKISRIHLEVPVFNGTDEGVLNRGVGRIIGTAHVGERGNLGIAGHRDGFFRALKDVTKGDQIELIAARGRFLYQVDNITVVNPNDVRILEDRGVPTITLVTCFPFYFIGDAPQRYILQCALKRSYVLSGVDEVKSTTRNRIH